MTDTPKGPLSDEDVAKCFITTGPLPKRLPDTLFLSEVWQTSDGPVFVCKANDEPRKVKMTKYVKGVGER